MNYLVLISLSLFMISGCASSEKNSNKKQEMSWPNLVTLNPPAENNNSRESDVYIDTAGVVSHNGKQTLLIKGQFPDGCTQLGSADYARAGDTLQITLRAWRDPNMMCAQVLTPFSFLYEDIPEKMLVNRELIQINGQSYQLNQD